MIVEILDNGKQKLKVGILGIMGPNACLVSAPTRKAFSFGAFDDVTNRLFLKLEILRQLANNGPPGQNKPREVWLNWSNFKSFLYWFCSREKHEVDVVIILLHGGHPEDVYLQEKVQGTNT